MTLPANYFPRYHLDSFDIVGEKEKDQIEPDGVICSLWMYHPQSENYYAPAKIHGWSDTDLFVVFVNQCSEIDMPLTGLLLMRYPTEEWQRSEDLTKQNNYAVVRSRQQT